MDNKKHGEGCFIHESGSIMQGEFIDDHFNETCGSQKLEVSGLVFCGLLFNRK